MFCVEVVAYIDSLQRHAQKFSYIIVYRKISLVMCFIGVSAFQTKSDRHALLQWNTPCFLRLINKKHLKNVYRDK